MTDLRTAAQQALDALKDDQYLLVEVSPNQYEYKTDLAIAALRAALAQQAEPVAAERERCAEYLMQQAAECREDSPTRVTLESCAAVLRLGLVEWVAQQAEPVEPVAWEGWWLHHGQHNYRAKPLTSERVKELMKLAFEVGREAAPPKLLPLTEEEIEDIYLAWDVTPGRRIVGLVRAVERALEEKNRGR